MSDCDGIMHAQALEGVSLFNRGLYFEAHEALELAWKDERGKIRELYQGILEAGVTYLHIRRGNYAGAIKVYDRSMRRLRGWPDICLGADVGQLRRDLSAAVAEARRLGPGRLIEFDPSLFKPILWKAG